MQGCLKPITISIPEGSILCPSPEAAVVGGNVLTSQRVTDVVLKAFNAAAASQVNLLPTSLCVSRGYPSCCARGLFWMGIVEH